MLDNGRDTMLLPHVYTTLPLASMTGEVGSPVIEVKVLVLATVWLGETMYTLETPVSLTATMLVPVAAPVAESTRPMGRVAVKDTGLELVPRPLVKAGEAMTEYWPLDRPTTVMVVLEEVEAVRRAPIGR